MNKHCINEEKSYVIKELLSILGYYENKNIQMIALEIDNELGRLKVIPLSNKDLYPTKILYGKPFYKSKDII